MKKLLFAMLMALVVGPVIGQTIDDIIEIERSVLKAEKKAIVAENMNFTEGEATVFWPLYQEFTNEEYQLKTERIKIIKEYAENYDSLDDLKADELMSRYLKLKTDEAKFNMKFFKKFKKVLPASKVARFFQIENKINAIINAELALDIPLVESK